MLTFQTFKGYNHLDFEKSPPKHLYTGYILHYRFPVSMSCHQCIRHHVTSVSVDSTFMFCFHIYNYHMSQQNELA